ncbi:MAG: hypothetical protein F6K40_18995 [Okeania sp. SIO3I5]|uniref:hypothetical protein n=1 Tax=Okeania sp. SIO3I5 TaxID=2607805 RepID=UPI0013B80232|nr:hypothetical protein [Okeania sp. SIO3I5]NEQ38235.1 hypothetical protein [Okeania sp. SIO3I5]
MSRLEKSRRGCGGVGGVGGVGGKSAFIHAAWDTPRPYPPHPPHLPYPPHPLPKYSSSDKK